MGTKSLPCAVSSTVLQPFFLFNSRIDNSSSKVWIRLLIVDYETNNKFAANDIFPHFTIVRKVSTCSKVIKITSNKISIL